MLSQVVSISSIQGRYGLGNQLSIVERVLTTIFEMAAIMTKKERAKVKG